MPDTPPYHELLALNATLKRRVEALEAALVRAQRDPREYRRGYEVGYTAGRRRADGDEPRPDRVQRRARGDATHA